MNEVLSVIKEMVFNNSIFLNVIVFIIIFNIFLMIFTYIYNEIYIKNYKDDFFDLFFGKENGLVFREVGGDLVVEPYRVCRRVNILRDYPDDKIKIYP